MHLLTVATTATGLPLHRNADVAVQGIALKLIAAVVKALGSSDRNLTALHTEALKAADRCLRDKASPVSSRCAAGAIITAVAEAGGSGFWANGGVLLDDTANTCLSAFLDLSPTLRDIFASALGEMAAASNAPSAKEMVQVLGFYPCLATYLSSKCSIACKHTYLIICTRVLLLFITHAT